MVEGRLCVVTDEMSKLGYSGVTDSDRSRGMEHW